MFRFLRLFLAIFFLSASIVSASPFRRLLQLTSTSLNFPQIFPPTGGLTSFQSSTGPAGPALPVAISPSSSAPPAIGTGNSRSSLSSSVSISDFGSAIRSGLGEFQGSVSALQSLSGLYNPILNAAQGSLSGIVQNAVLPELPAAQIGGGGQQGIVPVQLPRLQAPQIPGPGLGPGVGGAGQLPIGGAGFPQIQPIGRN